MKHFNSLELPVICAPMFLVSGPELVTACCEGGIIGAFPAANARTVETLEEWMVQLNNRRQSNEKMAPWALNMVVHRTYQRLDAELELVRRYRPQLVITSLGSPKKVVEVVHEYGGLVFSDVSDVRFARKAAAAGVDGLILVAAGAGGHAGELNSFAFVDKVRTFWDGWLVLAGGIATGNAILAARAAGCDLAYVGTRFIVAKESMAPKTYKSMLIESEAEDIVRTAAFSGVPANMLIPSIRRAGLDPERLHDKKEVEFDHMNRREAKAWKDIWSAGHGVGMIQKIETAKDVISRLKQEYERARERLNVAISE